MFLASLTCTDLEVVPVRGVVAVTWKSFVEALAARLLLTDWESNNSSLARRAVVCLVVTGPGLKWMSPESSRQRTIVVRLSIVPVGGLFFRSGFPVSEEWIAAVPKPRCLVSVPRCR